MNIEGKKALTIKDGILMNGNQPLRCPKLGSSSSNGCMGEDCACFKVEYDYHKNRHSAYCMGFTSLIELGVLMEKGG